MPIDNPISSTIPKVHQTKTCHCGKEFVPRLGGGKPQTHCSKQCRIKTQKRKEWEREYKRSKKYKDYRRKYRQSEQGKATTAHWRKSEKGKASAQRRWKRDWQKKRKSQKYKTNRSRYFASWRKSEKGKAFIAAYRKSDKGRAANRRALRNFKLRQRLAEAARQLAAILGEPIT